MREAIADLSDDLAAKEKVDAGSIDMNEDKVSRDDDKNQENREN